MNFNVKYNVFYLFFYYFYVRICTIVCSENALAALALHEIESALSYGLDVLKIQKHTTNIKSSILSVRFADLNKCYCGTVHISVMFLVLFHSLHRYTYMCA